MRTDSEGFLSRWSRLKSQANEPDTSTPQPGDLELDQQSAVQLQKDAEQALQKQADDGPILTDADMPSLDSLTEDSDFSPFMSEGVSDELRQLALRKLFRHAVFNVTDGLDEYAEDFTSFEKLGDIVTSDMKHRIEMEAKKRLAEKHKEAPPEQSEELEVAQDQDFQDQDPPSQLAQATNAAKHMAVGDPEDYQDVQHDEYEEF